MKGRTPTKTEKQFWDDLSNFVGCIACRKDGIFNSYVSIHHIDGRTKPDAHKLVLPLCFPHHQGDCKVVPSVHGAKRSFETRYGAQRELLEECHAIIESEKEK